MRRHLARLLAFVGGFSLMVHAATAQTAPYAVIHTFAGGTHGGAAPYGGLINIGDNLYGTTELGGPADHGSVFVLNRLSLATSTVYFFPAGNASGFYPSGSLLNVGGVLYGTTQFGGVSLDGGTVFSVNPTTGKEKVIHGFNPDTNDGVTPNGDLIKVNGLLYGTTSSGGAGQQGVVFSLNPYTGAETIVHSFPASNSDGIAPIGGLTNVGGTLYGTTSSGGSTSCAFGCGTVFSLNPTTGAETIVYSFQGGADGNNPENDLISIGGLLYGTTTAGGGAAACSGGCGTIFSLDPATGTEKVLYAFQGGNDGANPGSGSLVSAGGKLFGTTYQGGGASSVCAGNSCGTVFSFDLATKTETVLHAFQAGVDGANPLYGLLHVGGQFYGTTEGGGATGQGTVFEVTP